MFLGGRLYLMQSMMGSFAPDGGAHSYFCIFDGATGEQVACPASSSGHAASIPWQCLTWVSAY